MKNPATRQADNLASPSDITATHWDTVIVGGGPASSAAAIKLAQAGWQVLVLEHQPTRRSYGESLPPSSVNLVRELLGGINEDDYTHYGMRSSPGNKSSWVSQEMELFDFYSHPAGHGLCVDRQRFDEVLRQRVAIAGGHYCIGGKFTGCKQIEPNSWQVAVQHPDSNEDVRLTTRYLMDATGRQANVARAIGIALSRKDKLCAAIQLYESVEPQTTNEFTLLEATEDGWWYSNLLPDGKHRVVVFHTDRDLPQAKTASTPAGYDGLFVKSQHIFTELKNKQFAKSGSLKMTTACSQRLDTFVAENFVAIGDAAQAYDPLSSQGMAKALESGVKAGQLIAYALECGETSDIAKGYLRRYAQAQSALWQEYQKQFHYFYQAQPRWQDTPFWQRRCNNLQPLEKERLAI